MSFDFVVQSCANPVIRELRASCNLFRPMLYYHGKSAFLAVVVYDLVSCEFKTCRNTPVL